MHPLCRIGRIIETITGGHPIVYATSRSLTYNTKPTQSLYIPCRTCSGDMVFLEPLLHISLASDDNRWMNSVQQFRMSSRASFATLTLGTSSFIILLSAARGMLNSSSSFGSDMVTSTAGQEQ